QVATAAREALDALRPAIATYGTGRCAMNANRDTWDDERGRYVCGFNPDAPGDETVTVTRVTAKSGELLATVVNYGCHPTSLAWANTLLSPDYPGAVRETIERETGAPCIFALGACGDLGPRRGFAGDPEVADRNGRELGYAALAAITGLPPAGSDFTYDGPVVSGATLGCWSDVPLSPERAAGAAAFSYGAYEVELPLKVLPTPEALHAEIARCEARQQEADAIGDAASARDHGALAERARRWLGRVENLRGTHYPVPFSVLRLGDALWITCAGEPYSALQVALRRRFPALTVLVSPLAGAMEIAYLLPREAYGKGLYQEEPSILAAGCLEALSEAICRRVSEQLG
ncbi:MAG: Neutral/alkaline non-lysosomal ceramidase, partial [Armatimonadetes bacterium]|nr:Neutral/alkaline non-lysosomal ceramidase [Armatimonadota bacterium]